MCIRDRYSGDVERGRIIGQLTSARFSSSTILFIYTRHVFLKKMLARAGRDFFFLRQPLEAATFGTGSKICIYPLAGKQSQEPKVMHN